MSDPFDKMMQGADSDGFEESDLSLLETLDHVLNKGLVIAGEITISVADIDLIFVGLNVLVSSVEKAHEVLRERETNARSVARATLAANTPRGRQESE